MARGPPWGSGGSGRGLDWAAECVIVSPGGSLVRLEAARWVRLVSCPRGLPAGWEAGRDPFHRASPLSVRESHADVEMGVTWTDPFLCWETGRDPEW